MKQRYACALCEGSAATRYGFRMHMDREHGLRSTAHVLPGTGEGKGHPYRRLLRLRRRARTGEYPSRWTMPIRWIGVTP